MQNSELITYASLLLIVAVFCYFIWELFKLRKARAILQSVDKNNLISELKNTQFASIADSYQKSINSFYDAPKKTNYPASEFFNIDSISKCIRVNVKLLDTASGTLVGLGLLGTFLGLTLGIRNFDSSSSDNIQTSIQLLLGGMGMAFMTSLVGMFTSLVYTMIEKSWRNHLLREVNSMNDTLDKLYYIDDISLIKIIQEQQTKVLYSNLKNTVEEQVASLQQNLIYTNSEGNKSSIAFAVREILTQNEEQSKALKSFSTDLALELNNGFDETLSRQMQQKILPLMQNVDETTKAIIEHIDKVGATVAAPASDMLDKVVVELKSTMTNIVSEFKRNISGSVNTEMEGLVHSLSAATSTMGEFPKNMENISSTLQITIESVKKAVSEIASTSATSNSEAMQQMQEQITFATTSISNAIIEVKSVMENITKSSEQSSQDIISKLSVATEQMSNYIQSTISEISSSVTSSMRGMAEDVTNKQANLLSMQEDTSTRTSNLLESFNLAIEKLEKTTEYVSGTMGIFQQAQGQIAGSTGHLQSITNTMAKATEDFRNSQSTYIDKMNTLQENSLKSIDAIKNVLLESSEVSKDNMEDFSVIREGISSIFAQLQKGLTEYSVTVQSTTQKYLEQYSNSLTKTTEALQNTIQMQSDVIEMLSDSINKNRK